MASHVRKRVARVGVVLFVLSTLAPMVPLIWSGFLTILVTGLSGLVLFAAALMPSNSEETWGSMWPLVGYDNAIDGLYVRGPWWERFRELDELDVQMRTTTAMSDWFQPSI